MSKKIKQTNLDIVFIQETKFVVAQIEDPSKKIWKGSEGIGINAKGYVGGLGILWDPTRVSLGGFDGTRCLLSADFKVVGFPVEGMITNVYGPHKPGEIRKFIKSLRKVQEKVSNSHWIVGGDFNLITSLEEKKCCRCRMEEECENF